MIKLKYEESVKRDVQVNLNNYNKVIRASKGAI
jgi:hypothetical protein